MAKTVINTDPVVGDELIDIAWGNNVRGDLIRLADRKVELDGSLAMTGYLTLFSGNPSAANHAVRKGWLDAHFLNINGNTAMTGDMDMGTNAITNLMPTPPGANSATPRDWVIGEITDRVDLRVRISGDTMNGDLIVGTAPSEGAGVRLFAQGSMSVAYNATGGEVLKIRRGAAADAIGERLIGFYRGAPAGTLIGAIRIGPNSQNEVELVDLSDHRYKRVTGPITDAAERIRSLAAKAYRGTFVDDDVERDFINAHDVAEAAPYAVAEPKDGPALQMLDTRKLVPLLVAALGEALDRIAVLEAHA